MKFSIADDDSVFEIQGDATLVAKRVFDYEEEDRYTVTIKVEDEEGMFSTKLFTVKVW